MAYYIIKNANEPEITGNVFPQISEHKAWCWDNYEFFANIRPDTIPTIELELNYLKLHPKAKLTNFLSDGKINVGFIIDRKVKSILENFKLPEHKFFKASVQKGESFIDEFYWFFPVSKISNLIDFSNSLFEISDRFVPSIIFDSHLKLKSVIEIIEFEKTNPEKRIRPERVSLLEGINVDFFQFGVFSYDWIITEALKNKLEESALSGFEVKQIKWL